MEITLTGKRALVTGGNSGIGAAIALELAKAGAKVAINYVSHPEIAEQVVHDIQNSGGEAISIEADVSSYDLVAKMFTTLDEAWGGIDILINNAGIDGVKADSWDVEIKDWETVMNINLMGNFYCARQALKRMVPQKSGVILSTSSVHELIAWTGHSAYTTSKAGISMLTKTLAQEAAPYNVRVLALAPGAIKTTINQNVWNNQAGLDDLLEKIPLHRIGEPEEVARMAVVLVSDVASYVTGRTIFVDGGMTDYPDFAHGG
jgi:NAD(P)-dependent dehydrogenase (short-subunit alcohol dehydrogenase family)